ncbi:hypothetical protein FA95DRAFT_1597434 [Auriscalpium vulgare]|uniref:Uncharacterized protein n=1 Tax=Auriscalpium vulgare TaxID=40419 RepID=A0ACB8RL97_9AGAM|nr:hypothetical protein FA95DRAFT_1597434 [Auriscalpium vulgare]
MTSPGTSPADFQAHIYNSFLEGSTADVALRVRGTWDALYKLHRVVLIQAGFFRSLFTGGFLESADKIAGTRGHPDQIDIEFDDTNITRAAFELCIARLYGGGPPLYVDPSIMPTAAQPLTPSFPHPSVRRNAPIGQQPASPRFLLSLVAVSVYLSIPSMVSQALANILRTMGPFTVVSYLNFAAGKGIGELEDSDLGPAVSLESVAKLIKTDLTGPREHPKVSKDATFEDTASVASKQTVQSDPDAQKVDPAELSSDSDEGDTAHEDMHFHYGAVSDKIGEAAVCWLARWGTDILVAEQQAMSGKSTLGASISGKSPARRATVTYASPSTSSGPPSPQPAVAPVIWRRGGLDPTWVRALISSDSLFVKNEKERYEMAKAVVELRRNEGIDEDEEVEWTKMFAEGIYFANMVSGIICFVTNLAYSGTRQTLDDLVSVSNDLSPTTNQPYVPLEIIQSAHWDYSLVRHRIVGGRSSASSPPSSPTRTAPAKDLGLASTIPEITGKLHTEKDKDRPYWPVPADASARIGPTDNSIEGASMDELFEVRSASPAGARPQRTSMPESAFFGLKTERRLASELVSGPHPGPTHWLPYPPFRFSVEFWDVDALREKLRLHSQTIWYAGTLYNVYVQLVRKKSQGAQLGVYLHRQSTVDPIPASSTPSALRLTDKLDSSSRARAQSQSQSPSPPSSRVNAPSSPIYYSSSGLPIFPASRSDTPVPGSPSPSSPAGSSLPATAPPIVPSQPYRDPRGAVSAYFSISCASATGASITRFTSAPDVFTVSQSWGWKSSSLRTEEYLEVPKDGESSAGLPGGKEVSLRVTVVIGIV